jgi:hypothetical protein
VALAVSVWEIVLASPIAFAAGVLVGYRLRRRYRIVRLNGERNGA